MDRKYLVQKISEYYILFPLAFTTACQMKYSEQTLNSQSTAKTTILSVNSSNANGAYSTNNTIDIQINFSKNVIVSSGTPTLDLNSNVNAFAVYQSGSGSSILTFRYTVNPTDTSSDLDYPQTSSLHLAGATITDINGNPAILTLPAIGDGTNLGALKNIIIDTTPPTAPGSLTMGSLPILYKQKTPTFTFTESTDDFSGVASYQIEIYKASDNSIIKPFTIATGNGSGLYYDGGADFLTAGESYYAKIRAIDIAGNTSNAVQSGTWLAFQCPTNFVAVPAKSPYTTSPFCVAKYEMKLKYNGSIVADGNFSGILNYDADYDLPAEKIKYLAVSDPNGRPWVNVVRGENGSTTGQGAIEACQSLGAGYDLISNAEWQTIAQNIELTASNWTSGVVGTEMLYRGHSNGAPGNSLSISNISDSYDQTGENAGMATGSGKEQRRTLNLSNGEVLWDMAGNVWEWVKDNNLTNFGLNNYMSQITDTDHPTVGTIGSLTGTAQFLFGASGNYTGLAAPQYGGLGHGFINYNSGAIIRGGSWVDYEAAGIFYVYLNNSPANWYNAFGFRCTYH